MQAGSPLREVAEVKRIHAIFQACQMFARDHCGPCKIALDWKVF